MIDKRRGGNSKHAKSTLLSISLKEQAIAGFDDILGVFFYRLFTRELTRPTALCHRFTFLQPAP
jgi:hypothetical protein